MTWSSYVANLNTAVFEVKILFVHKFNFNKCFSNKSFKNMFFFETTFNHIVPKFYENLLRQVAENLFYFTRT